MSPKVSVIIPAYNTEKYIAKAIESALEQTLQNLEVVVVDDGSSDGTVDVVKQFTDPRVRLLVNPRNLGAGGARNRALEAAQGDWVAVLDSDDWYAPQRLERLLQIADAENADMIADDLYLIRDGADSPRGTLIGESGHRVTQNTVIDAVRFIETDVYGRPGLHLGISKPLFKREFLVKHKIRYDETIKVAQDFWIDLDCLMRGARFILVPEPYYFYISRVGSLVGGDQIERVEEDCRAIREFLRKPDIEKQHPAVAIALRKNLAELERNQAYLQVVNPLKRLQIKTALGAMLRYPYFFVHSFQQLPKIVNRRVRYFLHGERVGERII